MSTSKTTALHLSHVALGVPDVDRAVRFYTGVVGLVKGNDAPAAASRLGWGRGHHALELRAGQGMDHFALEVDLAELERLERRIAERGISATWRAADGTHPASLALADPDGNQIELHGPVDRSGEYSRSVGRRPLRIHHITLVSTNLERLVTFYVDVLGLRISDQMGDVFTWLRSNAEHHTIAVVSGDRCGLDHYAYEIEDWDAIKRWCDDLAVEGVPLTWGPGRHGPGANLFVMFDDPAGHRIELSCEMERFWDGRAEYPEVPRRWDVGPRTINLWGPSPLWRD